MESLLVDPAQSISRGIPLSEEQGIGALTLGVVQLEALACGCPVAAYPVTGPVDVIGNSPAGVLDEDLRAAHDHLEEVQAGRPCREPHEDRVFGGGGGYYYSRRGRG